MMGESWYLKLMGFPELRRPDGRTVKLKVRKHLALLIYLVLDARERYPRDELADLLWPEVPDGNGRHSLSMAFSVLRGLFGADCIQGNHVEVKFKTPGLALDLEQLERGDVLGNATTPALDVEGFLRGFEIEDAPAFQHWCDRRNAQLLPLLQAAVLALTDQARRSGDMQRMMALADRLLALDPLSEEGIRARMEAFAMQGDRVSALREFETWKRQLADELGAVPSEILEMMAVRLRRRGFESVPSSAGSRVTGEQWTERRFVGRAAEFQVLFEAWESTTQLNTRHVLLSGETGIGKSTLAMRFAASAALEGAAVARVQCFELEQRIPFGMIDALVTSLLDRPAVAGTAPESLAEVARIVPKLRERFPHLPAPRASEGEAARLHFAEGTFALLDAIMEEQPLVLIVDDYPRSDEASLSVLHMLLRRAGSEQIMVVLSGRPPEPDEPPQAARIRKGIAYLPLRRLELGALSEPESEDLLQA
ncbi:MAG TPA: AAA family ATPase, partial [Thermoanaerobaculia bacterium]|nr:AAA family ATPase [Thermoanaerobaculia bacterium]